MRELIRQLRRERGLSQRKLADALQMSEAAVNKWERGKNRPAPAALMRMAGLASPELSAKLEKAFRDYEWHPRTTQATRYSEETRQQLITALDMILDNADSTVVQSVTATIEKYAARFGSPPDKPQRSRHQRRDAPKKRNP